MIRRLLHKLINIKYFNRWVIFSADMFFSACCTLFALLLFGGLNWIVLALSVAAAAISFFILQTYKGVIRHASFIEAGRLGVAALLKVIIWTAGAYFIFQISDSRFQDFRFQISDLNIESSNPQILKLSNLFFPSLIDFLLTSFALVFIRVIMIAVYNYIVNTVLSGVQEKENLLIFDAGMKSFALLGNSISGIEQEYRLKGLVRFGTGNRLRINNQTVYSVSDQKEFNRLANRLYIKAVLFPDDVSVREESERFVRFCEKKKIRMLIMPKVDEVNKKIKFLNLPEVKIEDLLEREEIRVNMAEIAASLAGKTVLVTGAAGSIGSELCRQFCRLGLRQLVMLDNAETPMHNISMELADKHTGKDCVSVLGDVRNRRRMDILFKKYRPDVVFHAAAYKHVPIMEEHPCEAVATNVCGTMTVADIAVKYGVDKFIMISSDKAVNPSNVMGASKRLAEIYVQSLGLAIAGGRHAGRTRFVTTRFGNVLGSSGSVIPRFRSQLRKGGPLTVTHPDIIRYFMTIPEACRLVLEAACMGNENEIYVFDMGTPVKIADLARRMIELAGLVPDRDIRIEYTGLRAGEKLYEELLNTEENTLPTFNEKIFRAQVQEYQYEQILPEMSELCETAQNIDFMETVRRMKLLVPEFISQQSKYECLDNVMM